MCDWIEWGGAEQPVEDDALVEVLYRNGESPDKSLAKHFDWHHVQESSDILFYRVIEKEDDWSEYENLSRSGYLNSEQVEELKRELEENDGIRKGGSSPNQYRKSLNLPLTDNRGTFVDVDLEIMDICQAWGFQQEEHNIVKAFSRDGVKDSGDELYDARKVMMFALLYARRNGLYDNKRMWELVKELGL